MHVSKLNWWVVNPVILFIRLISKNIIFLNSIHVYVSFHFVKFFVLLYFLNIHLNYLQNEVILIFTCAYMYIYRHV